MNVEPTDARRAAAAPATTPTQPFAGALARARAAPALLGCGAADAGVERCGGGPGALLRRRRIGAEEGDAWLERRRDESEPTAGARVAEPSRHAGAPEPAVAGATAGSPGALLSPAALERIAIEAGRVASGSFVEVGFGPELRVRITQVRGGVELVLDAPSRRAVAAAELPSLVAAVRARGVEVARAEVREPDVRASVAPVRGARGASLRATAGLAGSALTPCRGSATTAAAQHPGGTVAKW